MNGVATSCLFYPQCKLRKGWEGIGSLYNIFLRLSSGLCPRRWQGEALAVDSLEKGVNGAAKLRRHPTKARGIFFVVPHGQTILRISSLTSFTFETNRKHSVFECFKAPFLVLWWECGDMDKAYCVAVGSFGCRVRGWGM